jgi:benzoylformate decarboxylase
MQVRNVPGLDLPGIDFVKIAEAMGCDAVRVNKAADLAPALARALAHRGVSVVDVIVDSAVPLLYARQGRA